MSIVSDIRTRFARVNEETRKAASYLTMSRAILRVPNFARRVTDSDVQAAIRATRDGMHMAFVVTLAATYEEKGRTVITIPKLIASLQNPQHQFALAKDNDVDRAVVEVGVKRVVQDADLQGHMALRNEVVAHHGPDTTSHGSTNGPLNRIMLRTRVLGRILINDSQEGRKVIQGSERSLGDGTLRPHGLRVEDDPASAAEQAAWCAAGR